MGASELSCFGRSNTSFVSGAATMSDTMRCANACVQAGAAAAAAAEKLQRRMQRQKAAGAAQDDSADAVDAKPGFDGDEDKLDEVSAGLRANVA